MTKAEKIERIKQEIKKYMESIEHNPYTKLAEDIIDAIEEPEPPKFRKYEIVNCRPDSGELDFDEYGNLNSYDKPRAEKITVEQLAHTTAPPDAVRWKLKDNSIIFFDKKRLCCLNYFGLEYITYCPHDGEEDGAL